MVIKSFHIKSFVWLTILLLSFTVSAQTDTDSIIAAATQQIYEDPDVAIVLSKKLLDDSQTSPDKKVRAIIIISTAYSSKRDYEKSMEYALSAMDLLPKIKNTNLKISLLNRIGGLYQELQINDKAIVYLDKALETIKELPEGESKSRNLGINNLIRGFVYRDQMSCEIALNYFEKGIEDYKKFPNSPGGNANVSISYYNRGECLLELGRINEAENSFLQSIEYAKKADATSAIAFAQKGLAKVYTFQEQYTKAIALLSQALQNSENVGDKVLNRALYDALATNYLATDDLKNAILYRNKNDSIHKQITKIERETLDDSINDLMETNVEKIKTLENRTKILQIVFIILILLGLSLIGRSILLSEKKLKVLKKRLKL